MKTTARWEGDSLMVKWFGGQEDEAAFLIEKVKGQPVAKPFRLIFDGYDETFVKDYAERPSAEQALNDIAAWQREG